VSLFFCSSFYGGSCRGLLQQMMGGSVWLLDCGGERVGVVEQ